MSDDFQRNFLPMSVGSVFRESLLLCRQMWRLLLGIVAPCAIIDIVVCSAVIGQQSNLTQTPANSTTHPAILLFAVLVIFLSYAGTALGTVAISRRFLGESVSIGQTYLRIADVFFPLIGTLVVASIATIVGLVTFAIPGLVVYGFFCLAPAVVTIEGEGGFGALKRSYVLVKGYWSKALFLVVILGVAQLAAATFTYSLARMFGAFAASTGVSTLLSILVPLLILEPLKISTTTLLYYDLRIRKEGYTVQIMADEIGALS